MQTAKTRFIDSVVLLSFLLSPIVTAQERNMAKSKNLSSETADAILKLERETMNAIKHKDADALGKILADDFVHRSPGGSEVGKAEFLKSITSLPVTIVEIWGEELKVIVFGDTAVLTGVQRVKARHADGKEEAGAGAFTDVFVRRKGRWWMVLAFSVDIPVEANKAKD